MSDGVNESIRQRILRIYSIDLSVFDHIVPEYGPAPVLTRRKLAEKKATPEQIRYCVLLYITQGNNMETIMRRAKSPAEILRIHVLETQLGVLSKAVNSESLTLARITSAHLGIVKDIVLQTPKIKFRLLNLDLKDSVNVLAIPGIGGMVPKDAAYDWVMSIVYYFQRRVQEVVNKTDFLAKKDNKHFSNVARKDGTRDDKDRKASLEELGICDSQGQPTESVKEAMEKFKTEELYWDP